MTQETHNGPHGLRLVLDSSQIFPDDPGQGTPAMVHCGEYDATFWCALGEGELDGGAYMLNTAQLNWLQQQEATVDAFMEKHS